MPEDEQLRRALDRYLTYQQFCEDARDFACREPGKFMKKVVGRSGREIVGKKCRSARDFSQELFDDLMPALYDACFIGVVGVFEKIVFDHLDNALTPMKMVMETGYQSGPFSFCAKSFVRGKDEIKNLGNVVQLLKGKIPADLEKDLTWIVDYRNRLAHGRRFGQDPAVPKDMQEVVETLERLLQEIAPS